MLQILAQSVPMDVQLKRVPKWWSPQAVPKDGHCKRFVRFGHFLSIASPDIVVSHVIFPQNGGKKRMWDYAETMLLHV